MQPCICRNPRNRDSPPPATGINGNFQEAFRQGPISIGMPGQATILLPAKINGKKLSPPFRWTNTLHGGGKLR